jgi:glycosyltransferase involved in cell wall biosynthesis
MNKLKKTYINKPLVSIVTVVFNGERHLEETILSIVNQTYNNIEYIIIDGGSTDGTIDIIKKYKGAIDYWKSETDKGIYDAMNKGVVFANGDWLNFMNAGDSFSSENGVKNFMKYKDTQQSLIYSDILLISDQGEENKIIQHEFKKYMFYRNICHQSIFYNYKKLRTMFFYDLSYQISSDFDLLLKIYMMDPVGFSIKNNRVDVKYLDGGLSSLACKQRVDERQDIFKNHLKYLSIEYFMNYIKTRFNKYKCSDNKIV